MRQKANDLMLQNRVFIWIALATGAILLIPLIAMQFTTEVKWDETDFIVMGSLLFGIASLFVLAARRAPRKRRLLIGGMFGAAFLYVWAELAVGVFTNLGS
jgi:peptidoglycan/LPS O-acetylase OafA/YrhL